MLETLFWIAVGAFIGWHFPEPVWARMLKDRALSMFQKSSTPK